MQNLVLDKSRNLRRLLFKALMLLFFVLSFILFAFSAINILFSAVYKMQITELKKRESILSDQISNARKRSKEAIFDEYVKMGKYVGQGRKLNIAKMFSELKSELEQRGMSLLESSYSLESQKAKIVLRASSQNRRSISDFLTSSREKFTELNIQIPVSSISKLDNAFVFNINIVYEFTDKDKK